MESPELARNELLGGRGLTEDRTDEIIEQIRDLSALGLGPGAIAYELNKRGNNPAGPIWTALGIRAILTNMDGGRYV